MTDDRRSGTGVSTIGGDEITTSEGLTFRVFAETVKDSASSYDELEEGEPKRWYIHSYFVGDAPDDYYCSAAPAKHWYRAKAEEPSYMDVSDMSPKEGVNGDDAVSYTVDIGYSGPYDIFSVGAHIDLEEVFDEYDTKERWASDSTQSPWWRFNLDTSAEFPTGQDHYSDGETHSGKEYVHFKVESSKENDPYNERSDNVHVSVYSKFGYDQYDTCRQGEFPDYKETDWVSETIELDMVENT
jgi:hypothetical protein